MMAFGPLGRTLFEGELARDEAAHARRMLEQLDRDLRRQIYGTHQQESTMQTRMQRVTRTETRNVTRYRLEAAFGPNLRFKSVRSDAEKGRVVMVSHPADPELGLFESREAAWRYVARLNRGAPYSFRVVPVPDTEEVEVEVGSKPVPTRPALVELFGVPTIRLEYEDTGKPVWCGNLAFLHQDEDGRWYLEAASGVNQDVVATDADGDKVRVR